MAEQEAAKALTAVRPSNTVADHAPSFVFSDPAFSNQRIEKGSIAGRIGRNTKQERLSMFKAGASSKASRDYQAMIASVKGKKKVLDKARGLVDRNQVENQLMQSQQRADVDGVDSEEGDRKREREDIDSLRSELDSLQDSKMNLMN